MMHARPVPLTIYVHPAMLDGLAKAARQHGNLGVAAYGEMLLSAAYAARIGQEKGQPDDDRELDAMVRLTLACAGAADSAAIARFLGLEESLVMKALAGWRMTTTQRRPARQPAGRQSEARIETPRAEPAKAAPSVVAVEVKPLPAPAMKAAGSGQTTADGLTDKQALLLLALCAACPDDAVHGVKIASVCAEAGLPPSSFVFQRNRLVSRGLIVWSSDGRGFPQCRITASGRAAAREMDT